VGDPEDEAAHNYEAQGQTLVRRVPIRLQDSMESEAGRGNALSESFRMKLVPWRDNHVVKLYDASSVGQQVRVYLDDEQVGDWSFQSTSKEGLVESTFLIPGGLVGDREDGDFRFEFIDGQLDVTSFMYWVFADATGGLTQPLDVDVSGMVLVDFLDIGNKKSEAEHVYKPPEESRVGVRWYTWSRPYMSFRESIRHTMAASAREGFRMKFSPGKDHLLIKAYDSTSRGQKIAVSINGRTLLRNWTLPDSSDRYSEAGLMIPASAIGQSDEGAMEMELRSGMYGANGFAYWLFASAPGNATQD